MIYYQKLNNKNNNDLQPKNIMRIIMIYNQK